MRIGTVRRSRQPALPGVVGVARVDRDLRHLLPRLRPGDIAVLDEVDLDRASAEALVAARVGAVVNAAPSSSGRYPNLGPEILLSAGLPLVDAVGPGLLTGVRDGELLRVAGAELSVGERALGSGVAQSPESVSATMAAARAGLAVQLESFAASTMEFLRQERDLLLDGVGVPQIRTRIEGRPVLVVVRDSRCRAELAALRGYLREYRPVLIGVDEGADTLRAAGYRPDLVVGDPATMSDEVLRSGAEVVVHGYPDGHAPGRQRVRDLGVAAVVFPSAATSADLALLLAHEKGAELIVTVGTRTSLVEFLDQGRAGMASTFVTRLRVGAKLVDAEAVTRLHRSRIRTFSLLVLVLTAALVLVLALGTSASGAGYSAVLLERWRDLVHWLSGVLP